MTAVTFQAPSDATDVPRGRPRPSSSCALCRNAAPATPLGLCIACLGAAAGELARLAPRAADAHGSRPSSVPYRDLYREPPCEHGDPRGTRGCAIDGAKTHFASVLAAYDEVMPMLTTDEMTTAEALRRSRAA